MVVERYADAHLMQRGSVALHILYRIGIGVEHIVGIQHTTRLSSSTLQHIVVVSIDTGYHIWAYFLSHKIHQYRFLATLQLLM